MRWMVFTGIARMACWVFCAVFLAGVGLVPVGLATEQADLSSARSFVKAARADTGLLPAVLGAEDKALYERIFLIQESGKWKESAQLIAQLTDPILLGHVTEQRLMHPTDYRSPYAELKDWLAHYGDHPGAWRVYKLARRRQNDSGPERPEEVVPTRFVLEEAKNTETAKPSSYGGRFVSSTGVIRGHDRQARKILARVRINVIRERLTVTEKSLRGEWRKHLTAEEFHEGLARVAAGWLRWGEYERALTLAEEGALGGGAWYPLAHWTAGLTAWQLGETARAWDHFASLSTAALATPEWQAKGAWWAARAALRLRRPEVMSDMLRRAADLSGEHLYGLMARAALGMAPVTSDWRLLEDTDQTQTSVLSYMENLPAEDLQSLSRRLHRAIALLQVGQVVRAEAELLQLGDLQGEEEINLVLILADAARLPRLSLRAAADLSERTPDEKTQNTLLPALYPLPPWVPSTGFAIDRAFLYAMMREESRFNPRATSRDGARGVMQLLPSTAAFIAGERSLRSSSGRGKLYEPQLNLTLGQAYVLHLMDDAVIGDELLRMIAAYNGGPGNLRKWNSYLADRGIESKGDPLLYLEMLPSAETRKYAAKVLTSMWHYRARLGQTSPALQELAAGRAPLYTAQDDTQGLLRSGQGGAVPTE